MVISDQVKAATPDLAEQIRLQHLINCESNKTQSVDTLIAAANEPPPVLTKEALKQSLVLTLAPNYMKPSTATTPGGMSDDAERDANFLMLAVNSVLAKLP